MKLSKKLFCRHLNYPLKFLSNIHGDNINIFNGKRSIWQCENCGKIIFRYYLFRCRKI